MSIPHLIWSLGVALIIAAVGYGIVYFLELKGTAGKLVLAGFCLLALGYFLYALLGSQQFVIGPPG